MANFSDKNESQSVIGLNDSQVKESRDRHGPNILTPAAKNPWWMDYLEKFEDPVIRILLVAAFIAIIAGFFHGDYIEGIGIIVAILLATALAYINEYKAEQELDALYKSDDKTPVRTMRNGALVLIPKCDLVVDDVIQLEAGETVPADAFVISQVSILVDQTTLTGEKDPVSKCSTGQGSIGTNDEHTLPADSVFMGTTVLDGHGVFKIFSVGDNTKTGKATKASDEDTEEVTPLKEQLVSLCKVIGVVGFLMASASFIAVLSCGYFKGDFSLTLPQFWFALAVLVSTMVGLSKVWVPWVYDGFEMLSINANVPSFIEAEGFAAWIKVILAGLLLLIASVFILIFKGYGVAEFLLPVEASSQILSAFMIAVTIIVVAVPEGLAMSVTLSLAYSMRRMTQANTLVRQMHACETIGAATVICSDKTGTLTTSKMELQNFVSVMLPNGLKENDLSSVFIAESVAANSTADLSRTEKGVETLGNPTESALLLWLEKAGPSFHYLKLREQFQIESQLTFSTERKFMATFGRSSALNGTEVLYVKGAPEIILARCSTIGKSDGVFPKDEASAKEIENQLVSFQSRGMRTIGIAWRNGSLGSADLSTEAVGLTWMGFAVIDDPVRPEVPKAIRSCIDAGIEVKIITGDNTPTAREIGRQIGLDVNGPGATLTGSEFAAMNDEQALLAVKALKVLSRAQPLHKQRAVQLLQKQGEVVAVTGDGVNDGPALNYADVGLAMGITGTSVARAASDMVILDDSFGSIASGVMWGRSLYRNIQRFIVFQLTINVAALVIALLGPFIGVAIPLNVIQMLWVNLIMDTFAALALATEPADPSVMKDRPRGRGDFIITPEMSRSIFGWGIAFVVVLGGLLLWMKSKSESGEISPKNLTIFFCVFVMLQFWNIFNARRFGGFRSAFSGLLENPLFVIITVAILAGQIVIVQFGGTFFKTVPLSLEDWLLISACTSPVIFIGEIGRFLGRSKLS
jgi:P-type Ca2+ transporter type 2C